MSNNTFNQKNISLSEKITDGYLIFCLFVMSLLKTYYPTLKFIGKFILIYVLLVSVYNFYLPQDSNQTDVLTLWVGKLVSGIYAAFGLDVQTLPLAGEAGLKLIVKGHYVARIVEGCTAMSIIIMFAALVLSLGRNLQKTLLFTFIGSLLIFVFNLLRIVFLGYLLYALPQYQDTAHRLIFPALIYGFVVLLWFVFIKKYNDD